MPEQTIKTATVEPEDLIARVRGSRLPMPSERRRIRQRAGVSYRGMGEVLGVTAMTVLRWERGQRRPTLANAKAYRQLLDALERASR